MAERGLVARLLPPLREARYLRPGGHANALLRTEAEVSEKWNRKVEPHRPSLQLPSKTRGAAPELMQAVIEEADVWWTDVKKAISDFEKDINSTISSKKGSITASEKLLRYMEEKNRQRDLLREKLCLKNYLLRSEKKKLQQQLRQKEQMGETLCEVRLQQLQVRNAQYQEKIDEKNQELLQLKLTSGKTAQAFNFCKRKLQDAMATSTSLVKEISQRKELLEKIEREAALVEEQRAEAESVNQRLRKQLSDYGAPPVLAYVQKKMAVADLEKSLKAWERKVAVAEMRLRSHRRAWNQVKMSGNQHQALLLQSGQRQLQKEPALGEVGCQVGKRGTLQTAVR